MRCSSPSLREDEGQSYGDVITNFSRLNGSPIFVTNGALVGCFMHGSSIDKISKLVPIVERLNSAVHCINHYYLSYPVNRDISPLNNSSASSFYLLLQRADAPSFGVPPSTDTIVTIVS